MKLNKNRAFALLLGITIFLTAFGIAFAAVWVQGELFVTSGVKIQTAAIISGDQMWMLWKDPEMTEPIVSGDGPYITFFKVESEPPVQQIKFVRTPPIFIQNVSNTFARPIEPCREVIISGQPVGFVSAQFRTVGPGEQDRGDTCQDDFPSELMMSPGEKWVMHINLVLKQPLPDGDNFFEMVIGGIGVTGDVPTELPTPIDTPTGMVGWWPGDGSAIDIWGVNHGTLQGDTTFTGGMVGQAFSFDGEDDVVEIADSPGLVPGPAGLTVEAWVNPSSGGAIFSDHSGCVNWESTELSTSRFIINSSDLSSTRQSLTFATLQLGLWSHIAAVWDGSEMLVYVNGEVVATASAPSPPWNPSSPFVIGGRKTTHDCHGVGTVFSEITGLVDELGYYDRAFTAAEVKAIYDAGSAGKRKPTAIEPPGGMVSW